MTGPDPFSLDGKLALVTGSSQGIGLALAGALLRAGARVVLNGRDPDRLEAAHGSFREEGLESYPIACDVTDEAAVTRLADKIRVEYGELDILVNNVGGTIRKTIQNLSLEEWNRIVKLNLDTAFLVSREFIPAMIERREGRIINTCSVMSEIARTHNSVYAATKGGVRMFTRALSVELGPHNIQVNGIAPGYFATPMTAELQENADFDRWVRARTPMGRWGSLQELGGAVVFLAGPAGSFVSGQILYVDGGFTAAM